MLLEQISTSCLRVDFPAPPFLCALVSSSIVFLLFLLQMNFFVVLSVLFFITFVPIFSPSWSFSVVVLHLYLKKCWDIKKIVFFLFIKVKKTMRKIQPQQHTNTHSYLN